MVFSDSAPAGKVCSSYCGELVGLRDGLHALLHSPRSTVKTGPNVPFCSDSRSAIEKFSAGAAAQRGMLERDIWRLIEDVSKALAGVPLTFQ